MLKIATDLSTATWGNSNELDVGDWVLAVGNPYGLDRTVTCGIVTAQHNAVRLPKPAVIRISCKPTRQALIPGNSGGPLVNMFGEVVVATTAIVGHRTGISFAIPSEVARRSYEQIIKNGPVGGDTWAWRFRI